MLIIPLQVVRCNIPFWENIWLHLLDFIHTTSMSTTFFYYQMRFHSLQGMIYNWSDRICGFLAKSYYFVLPIKGNISSEFFLNLRSWYCYFRSTVETWYVIYDFPFSNMSSLEIFPHIILIMSWFRKYRILLTYTF